MSWESALVLVATLAAIYAILAFGVGDETSASTSSSTASTWTTGRTMLIVVLLVGGLGTYAIYRGSRTMDLSDATVPASTRLLALAAPLRDPLFWGAVALSTVVALYAYLLDGSATAVTDAGGNGDNNSEFRVPRPSALSPVNQLLAYVLNAVLLLTLVFGGLFLAGWVIDLLQFQRNDMGLLAHGLVYLPCLVYEFALNILYGGEGEGIDAARRRPGYPALMVVVLALLSVGALTNPRMFRADLLWAKVRSAGARLAGDEDEPGGDGASSSVATVVQLVPASDAVRLHREWSYVVGHRPGAPPTITPMFGIRARLFLNSQQQRPTTLFGGSGENVISIYYDGGGGGGNRPMLSVRAHADGLRIGSSRIGGGGEDLPAVPAALQRWHDLVVEFTFGGASVLTATLNGELVLSADAMRATLDVPAFLDTNKLRVTIGGQNALHGVISDLAVVARSAP